MLSGAKREQEALIRDIEVNRRTYEDLTRKKEQARLSLDLDLQGSGASLRIYEAAFFPTKPIGIHFLHFMAVSQILGLGIPLGMLLVRQLLDGKIRSRFTIEEGLGYPVVASIPRIKTLANRTFSGIGAVGIMIILGINLLVLFDRSTTQSVQSVISEWPVMRPAIRWMDSYASRL
jgi:hypothetical protein